MRCIVVLLAAVLTTACSPLLAPPFGPSGFRTAARYHRPEPPVIGRWDNVVGIRPGTAVGIVVADGSVRTGTFIKAALRSLQLQVDGGTQELARADVLRVDVLADRAGTGTAGEIAAGAAKGALGLGGVLMAIPYLATGDVIVPPARFWGLGAVVGGLDAAEKRRAQTGERTVYIAPELVGG